MAGRYSPEGPLADTPEDTASEPEGRYVAVIRSPAAGQEVAVQVGEASAIDLRFDPAAVQVAEAQDDLVLKFPDGGQLALQNFTGEEGRAPTIILPDGRKVEGEALLQQLDQAILQQALETEAGPAGNGGGGGVSVYQSNLGELIAGLQSDDASDSGVTTPASSGFAAPDDDDPVLPTETDTETTPAPAALAATFVPPANPVGPGAKVALFSRKADEVDLNAIDVGGYLEGTQYDAGNGHDTVVLAQDARQALEAGFDAGTLFDAGKGNDHVTGGNLADLINGAQGRDTLLGGAGDDSLFGAQGNDSLVGGADDDLLNGAGGRDTLDGGLGGDLLDGGGSHDLLLAGAGDDTVLGGGGRDTLAGGLGDDVISGGNGRDVFSFSLAENQGDDLILDFKTGNNGDRLEIADLVDENDDGKIDVDDLDDGAHSVTGTADAVVITFDNGARVTLDGIDGSGVDSFDDLLDIKVNLDIV
ncbi:calcium-binding protein [Pelagibius sp.]|uniref:calcium-binding protein n=1 Tax=Pelagibius sp. TaxID=1931238 RepID=UPI002622BFE9|nr:hypothetical protein [Pelagibius sp.]